MPTGTVKWYSPQKGYGFAIPSEGGSDIFIHVSSLEKSGLKSLTDGQKVSFELSPDREGRLCADQIKLVG